MRPLPPVAAGALWAELSPGWVCTDGMMMAMDLVVGRKEVFGLRGLLVDESESWESWTVTQLITLVLWLVPELQEEMKHFSKSHPDEAHLRDGRLAAHQAAENFLSSSSSESLWMVMMLTAGLGVSEMTMGCDWSPAKEEVLWTTEVAESTDDTGLERQRCPVAHHKY